MTDIHTRRKRIQPARSKTLIVEDTEDRHSEHGSTSDILIPRRRPKLSKYISNYLAITTPVKPEGFSRNFWDTLGEPIIYEPKVDSLQVLESISSTLIDGPHKALPIQQNSSLLHLLEDYRGLRLEKDKIEELLRRTLGGFKEAEERWTTEEAGYRAEIRRLELIIARGKQGMTELIRTRQDSVIKRKRTHHKSSSNEKLETAYEFLSRDQIYQDAMRQGRRVLIHRSSSPSAGMTALSKTFSNTNIYYDLPFGRPPHKHYSHSLSQRAESETSRSQGINSSQNGYAEDQSDGYSTFSSTGDPLPDEVDEPAHSILDARGQEEDFAVALQQLAVVVARRHGAEIETVFPKLMNLISGGEQLQKQVSAPEWMNWSLDKIMVQSDKLELDSAVYSHERRLKRFRSQPRLISGHSRHRHFSSAPGDDIDISSRHQSASMYHPPPLKLRDYSSSSDAETPRAGASVSKPPPLSSEARKPSKIPSPLNEPSMTRLREDSGSSLLTTIHHDGPGHRESSPSSLQSVVTAVHHDSRRTSRIMSNRSLSNSAGYLAGQRLVEQRNSLRNSAVALAAARAAEGGSGRSLSAETSSDQRRHSKREFSRIHSKRRMATNINARNNSESESSEGPGAGDAGNGEDFGYWKSTSPIKR